MGWQDAPETDTSSGWQSAPVVDSAPVPETPDIDANAYSWGDYAANLARKVGQGVTFGFEDEAEAGLRSAFGSRKYRDILKERRDEEAQFTKAFPIASNLAELTGAVGSGLALGPIGAVERAAGFVPTALGRAAGRGAGYGGLYGGLHGAGTSEATDVGGVLSDVGSGAKSGALTGAVAGPVLEGLGAAAARTANPQWEPNVQRLLDEGVELTPGQITGGNTMLNRAEQGFQSVPLLGGLIRNARDRSTETFNRAAANRALEPIGQTVPANVRAGHELVQHVEGELGQAYDDVLSHMHLIPNKPVLDQINNTVRLAQKTMTPERGRQLENIIDSHVRQAVAHAVPPQPGMPPQLPGERVQLMQSELRRMAREAARDPSWDTRLMGEAIQDVNTTIDNALSRQNRPQLRQRLADVNNGWMHYVRVRDAASSIGAREGVFTPAHLAAAVRRGDNTVGHGGYARGTSPLQDLSDAGKSVISQQVNDSGTPERSLLLGLLSGATLPLQILLGGAAASGAYTAPMQRVIRRLMTQRRPATRATIENATRRFAPALIAGSQG